MQKCRKDPMYLRYIGPMQDLEITPRLAKLLRVFLEDPDQPRYGYELMKTTGLQSGSLYPALIMLEKHGWLTVDKEDIDPRAAGRPPRRSYMITAAAAGAARARLAALSETFRPPVPVCPALGGCTA
jgi:PadR family transcriptional regulator, regulatory protein PadR